MPNKPSAIKALRQSVKRSAIHTKLKDELKRTLKKARRIKDASTAEAQTVLKETVRMVDRAVRKKIIKKNTAARTKSRLMKLKKTTS